MAPIMRDRPSISTLEATRYVVPLREGGSLPAVIETDGGELFVVKFRGAGQGAKALVAELIVALLARRLDLPVPEPALIELDESFGKSERDPEIQDILRGSRGLNVGLRYLDGAFNFDCVADLARFDPELAARIVWLDAFTYNVDRTARNPNMLVWQGDFWLIDHGVALYFHHDWQGVDEQTPLSSFPAIAEHVLLERALDPGEVDVALTELLGEETITDILRAVPSELLLDQRGSEGEEFSSAEEARAAYARVLSRRLEGERAFVHEASRARREKLESPSAAARQYRR